MTENHEYTELLKELAGVIAMKNNAIMLDKIKKAELRKRLAEAEEEIKMLKIKN